MWLFVVCVCVRVRVHSELWVFFLQVLKSVPKGAQFWGEKVLAQD